jgi:alpha-aminoadipic semialdehyde synthase
VNDYKGIKGEDAEASNSVKRATIASNGQLQPGRESLAEKVEAWRSSQRSRMEDERPTPDISSGSSGNDGKMRRTMERKKRVLVLGSGMVAGPAVDELAARPDVELIVGECSVPLCLVMLQY